MLLHDHGLWGACSDTCRACEMIATLTVPSNVRVVGTRIGRRVYCDPCFAVRIPAPGAAPVDSLSPVMECAGCGVALGVVEAAS